MRSCRFPNDNNIEINIPEHEFSEEFCGRINSELMFRRIATYLINNKFITKGIIDLGSWIGDNSIPWSKSISGTVFAIDPSPNNCYFIKYVSIFNNINNIKIIQRAISDGCEYLSTNDTIDHCTFSSNMEGTNKVLSCSLDSLYSIGEIYDKIDFIHLDVEGMENKVIKGCTKIINNSRPIIAFEQHLNTDRFEDLCEFIKKKEYCVAMINEELQNCRLDCRNFIAFPHELVSSKFFSDLDEYLLGFYPDYENKDVFLRFF